MTQAARFIVRGNDALLLLVMSFNSNSLVTSLFCLFVIVVCIQIITELSNADIIIARGFTMTAIQSWCIHMQESAVPHRQLCKYLGIVTEHITKVTHIRARLS